MSHTLIPVPITDVNSEHVTLTTWHVPSGTEVTKGMLIAEVETSKALSDVFAPCDGYLAYIHAEGVTISRHDHLGAICNDKRAADAWISESTQAKQAAESVDGVKATAKARELASRHGIDLATFSSSKLITTKEVEEAIAKAKASARTVVLPEPLTSDGTKERVMIIGAGLGATQVMDIFSSTGDKEAVAIVDDNDELWGNEVYGVPVVGGSARLGELFEKGAFDTAIIAISTSVPARVKLRERCEGLGIPLTNAIDRSCRIGLQVKFGKGNVVCAFCHFGNGTVVGDNNFFSAYNSFDHHCTIGSDSSTGPSCVASGIVKIGDRVRMGTGIFIQPYLSIGSRVEIASGAVIVGSVEDDHAVKTKVTTTVTVPKREPRR